MSLTDTCRMCGHDLYQEMCVVDDCKCDCLAED
jgi:hypothetical protein